MSLVIDNPDARRPPAKLPEYLLPFWCADARSLLRATAVAEAHGQPYEGILQVLCTVRTRMQLPWWWGDDWWSVVLFPAQFSCWWGDDWRKRRHDALEALKFPRLFPNEDRAAIAVLLGELDPLDGYPTHYFNPDACPIPKWASHLPYCGTIAAHWFFSERHDVHVKEAA